MRETEEAGPSGVNASQSNEPITPAAAVAAAIDSCRPARISIRR